VNRRSFLSRLGAGAAGFWLLHLVPFQLPEPEREELSSEINSLKVLPNAIDDYMRKMQIAFLEEEQKTWRFK